MAKHCGKHDITVADGGECWNCEEAAMSSEERDANYSNPEFLAKRGGATGAQVHMSNAMHKLSQLSPEHLANLIDLAKGNGPAAGSGRRQIIA